MEEHLKTKIKVIKILTGIVLACALVLHAHMVATYGCQNQYFYMSQNSPFSRPAIRDKIFHCPTLLEKLLS